MDRVGGQRGARRAVREALGVLGVRGIEGGLARGADGLDATEEDVGGREEREARVMVLVVVPAEEALQPATSLELGGEAPRVVGLLLGDSRHKGPIARSAP